MRGITIQLLIAVSLLAICPVAGAAGRVALVADSALDAPAGHGLDELEQTLRGKGLSVDRVASADTAAADFLVLAGLAEGSGPAAGQLRRLGVALPADPEALVIRTTRIGDKPAVVLCGADSRGLMYAALEAAGRISWSDAPGDPFAHVRDTSEQPFLVERAVSMYTMQRAYFEQRLFDERYWERYFDLLARSRINSFVVIFGYENGGFLAPLYPYFFDVDGFPDVEMVGVTAEQQRRNVAAFHRMIRIAHDRGIDIVPAPWDHIYRGGVQGGGIAGAEDLVGRRTPGLVYGVTTENVAAYNKAAIHKFLDVFPEIDGIQFRMHYESGLKPDEMAGFWHEVFTSIKQERPNLRVDVRAKDLPDPIIYDGIDIGLKLRVTTKYWMEQQGLPFAPTHVNRQNQHDRRHGYADLLRYPQRYKVHWRLWTGGTARLLLWGDPEYVRRFVRNARLYDGNSFEVNEMLATKMLGEPHDAVPIPIHQPQFRSYEYEFERYWPFYELWGRLSYDPDTPPETWDREFNRHFGAAGPHVMEGLQLASGVLPRIVASSYLYFHFPTTRGWPTMMRQGDLPVYAAEQGSDIQQFLNVRDEARSLIEGSETAMMRPEENSRWFAHVADGITEQIAAAEKAAAGNDDPELVTAITDLKILASLARYHSKRLLAGVSYNLYLETGDLFAFDDAIAQERQAVGSWREIVAAADGVYSDVLPFGVDRMSFPRNWKEELGHLEQGFRQLRDDRADERPPWFGGAGPRIAQVPVRRLAPGDPLRIRATVTANSPLREVHALVSRDGGAPTTVTMNAAREGMYEAEVPASTAEGRIEYRIEAVEESGATAVAGPVDVTITADNEPPQVTLAPAGEARPGQSLRVVAEAQDPSGIEWIRLRYRHVTQFEDYQTVEMKLDSSTGRYSAEIPAGFVVPKWDLMYFVEALDKKGNGKIYPDLEHETPYVVVTLVR